MSEFIDQADIESNIETRNTGSGRRFPQYSISQYIDQATIESHIESQSDLYGRRWNAYSWGESVQYFYRSGIY